MLVRTPDNLPAALVERFARVADRLCLIEAEVPQILADSLGRVVTISEFVASVLERQPDRLLARVADAQPLTAESIAAGLALEGLGEDAAMSSIRRLRQVELARIAWRDIAGFDSLEDSLHNLSILAETIVRVALERARAILQPRFGRPRDDEGREGDMLVLAMGKLGGGELNFSSDIDLVFLYPDNVVFEGDAAGSADVTPQGYYLKLSQLLIKFVDQRTADGIGFRVDTRLRPFGTSGPLAISISAFESYLVSNGRDWERYGYQKARLITAFAFESELFNQVLTPFVYRRYLDFGMFDALRSMKRLIRAQVARKDMADNIKLGPGGIREIEFIVQVFQLIRGGQDSRFRSPSLMRTLPLLADPKQLGAQATGTLDRAYRFLRMLENRLQALADKQVHRLPEDEEQRARLAWAMDCEDWDALEAATAAHRGAVEKEFDSVARESEEEPSEGSEAARFVAAWEAGSASEGLAGTALGDNEDAIALLQQLRDSGLHSRMDEVGRHRLVRVLARTMPLLSQQSGPAEALRRILPVFEAVCRRSAYLALLEENPDALNNLLALTNRSGLLARQLVEHPLLLDELLDPRVFDTPPTREEFRKLLDQQLRNAPDSDLEVSLNVMRNFQSAAVFRIAVADTLGQLPLMKVSDRLTDTAEIVLQFALDLAISELQPRYGRARCGEEGNLRDAGFAVIAYGKLAGLELGYGSDLDLVFLTDSSGPVQRTDGASETDNRVYFARLAQRLIHFLSIQTMAGRLYEVDTRLRPDGQSGMLVPSLENFGRYQRKDAWTWEHQALLRSRAVAGDAAVCRQYEEDRRSILVEAVKLDQLKTDVLDMRRRMRQELSNSKAGQFDLKQDEGGLADIEFLVDYLVLGNAGQHPELVEFPDNIRQLEALARTDIMTAERADALKDCYLALRQRVHDLALDSRARVVEENELADVRAAVVRAWSEVFD